MTRRSGRPLKKSEDCNPPSQRHKSVNKTAADACPAELCALATAEKALQDKLAELEESRAALLASEARYRLAMEGSNDAIWDWDIITNDWWISPSWTDRLGLRRHKFQGALDFWRGRIHPDDVARRDQALNCCLMGGIEHYEVEYRFEAAPGRWLWLLAKGKMLFDELGQPVRMAGSYTDITGRKTAEEKLIRQEKDLRRQLATIQKQDEELRRQNKVLESVHEVALGLMQQLDLNELLLSIVDSVAKLTGIPDSYINLLDERRGIFVRKFGTGHYASDIGREIKQSDGLTGKTFLTGEIQLIENYNTWEHRLAGDFFDQIKTLVQVPLKNGKKVIGVFGLAAFDDDQKLNQSDIALLARYAELTSIALVNAQLYTSLAASEKALQEKHQELTSVHEELTSTEEELRVQYDEAVRINEQVSKQNAFLSALIDAMPDTMFLMSGDGVYLDAKVIGDDFAGILPGQIVGKTLYDLLPADIAAEAMRYIEKTLTLRQVQVFEYTLLSNGSPANYEARFSASGENEVLAIVRNITERKKMEAQLKYASLHDALTGLYNRAYFEEEMKRLAGMREKSAGIIICDVDGLKLINDSMGHHTGDAVLKAVAGILRSVFRPGDFIARIGGDEFAVLLTSESARVIRQACGRIQNKIASHNLHDPLIPINISTGYAVSKAGRFEASELFKEADNHMYREKLHRQTSSRSAIVQAMMKALEARDFITEGHGERLEALVVSLAKKVPVADALIPDLRLLARFHDIGKVGIPDSILLKNGRLDAEEYETMKGHCEIGYRIAKSTPDLAPIADFILTHQEWWNGKGYPLGLAGEAIPVASRILAIADAYDAMTSDRPYRKALSGGEAVAELLSCAGSQFDPLLVELFTKFVLPVQVLPFRDMPQQ